jgi:hypothetical protein
MSSPARAAIYAKPCDDKDSEDLQSCKWAISEKQTFQSPKAHDYSIIKCFVNSPTKLNRNSDVTAKLQVKSNQANHNSNKSICSKGLPGHPNSFNNSAFVQYQGHSQFYWQNR